jgi:membrane protein YqaA with SNARE-associated domain
MPLGNDLLMVALSASRHELMPYYAVMATAGSVLGCLLVDLVMRKGGEAGLERYFPRRRIDYIESKINKRAGWAIAFASLMPPPFPFTPFVAGAAAFQYPRKKMLAIIGVSRMIRFSVEGLLALRFGRGILSLAKSPAVEFVVITLVVIAIGGSAFSVYRWIKRSRQPKTRTAGTG